MVLIRLGGLDVSTQRLIELLWGIEAILICGGIVAVTKLRRMQRTVQSMQSQIDELIATHVLMQDHLDRIGQKVHEDS